ncbi:AraC-like DNA-binding protein [Runella defluvii]|uniref:AraC-like DNA-binding protein n=1 Tax=Runella defluvii TaxID=370973 RepID=A0A7W6ETS9_9BACT|nr:chromate resistance protein ChrB domain-containing protein [Runella defluvii]MBB3842083.1 AraC-like DNA-binding protein [Runella defluvii]
MKWITRERPKIDRIACPWLIRKCIDPEAEFIFVPFDQVLLEAELLNATPFDVPNVELTHYGDKCTFDALLEKYGIEDDALQIMAGIVRGADTDRHDFAPEAAGLWAISAGLAYNIKDDHALLEQGMVIYDALYSWATHLYRSKHLQTPFEDLLVSAMQKALERNPTRRKPAWAIALKEMIQDQIDTQLSLKDISKELDINPAYLSREFSKYFENVSYGDYIRKLRIEKALDLLENSDHTLTEIAYLTGFSDQSHFTRIFKKIIGVNPSLYRKTKK